MNRKIHKYSWYLCVGWAKTKKQMSGLQMKATKVLKKIFNTTIFDYQYEELPDGSKCVFIGPIAHTNNDKLMELEMTVRKDLPSAFCFMRETYE